LGVVYDADRAVEERGVEAALAEVAVVAGRAMFVEVGLHTNRPRPTTQQADAEGPAAWKGALVAAVLLVELVEECLEENCSDMDHSHRHRPGHCASAEEPAGLVAEHVVHQSTDDLELVAAVVAGQRGGETEAKGECHEGLLVSERKGARRLQCCRLRLLLWHAT